MQYVVNAGIREQTMTWRDVLSRTNQASANDNANMLKQQSGKKKKYYDPYYLLQTTKPRTFQMVSGEIKIALSAACTWIRSIVVEGNLNKAKSLHCVSLLTHFNVQQWAWMRNIMRNTGTHAPIGQMGWEKSRKNYCGPSTYTWYRCGQRPKHSLDLNGGKKSI